MENTRGYRGERWGKGDGGGRNEKSWPHFCPLIFGLEPTRSLAFNNKLFTFNRGKHDRWTERAPGRKGISITKRRDVRWIQISSPLAFPSVSDSCLYSVNTGNRPVCISRMWFSSVFLDQRERWKISKKCKKKRKKLEENVTSSGQ